MVISIKNIFLVGAKVIKEMFGNILINISGEIQQRGVVLPFAPVVYKSLLSRLRADGITAKEVVKPIN